MAIPLREVPLTLRRRAAQHLESLRASELATQAAGLELADEAWPLYRPDLKEVAYFEFPLRRGHAAGQLITTRAWPAAKASEILATAVKPRPEAGRGGFIVASTGEHDSPIPHWSLDREPPSQQLRRVAGEGADVAKIYRLDALCYAAENASGALITRVGQFPVLPQGLPYDALKLRGQIASLITESGGEGVDDGKAEGVEHRVRREGPSEGVKFGDTPTWEEYRARYADAMGPLLDAHRRRVAPAWAIERQIAELGEGVIPGEAHRVALLEPGAAIEIRGPGAHLVDARLIERAGGRGAVELHAVKPPERREVGFELHLTYASGERETLQFFVVTRDTPSNRRMQRPDRSPEGAP